MRIKHLCILRGDGIGLFDCTGERLSLFSLTGVLRLAVPEAPAAGCDNQRPDQGAEQDPWIEQAHLSLTGPFVISRRRYPHTAMPMKA